MMKRRFRKKNHGAVTDRRHINPLKHTYESGGGNSRMRGNAQQLHEKYMALGREAIGNGDRVMMENYYQYAEHYQRQINRYQEAMENRSRSFDRLPDDKGERSSRRSFGGDNFERRRHTAESSANRDSSYRESPSREDAYLHRGADDFAVTEDSDGSRDMRHDERSHASPASEGDGDLWLPGPIHASATVADAAASEAPLTDDSAAAETVEDSESPEAPEVSVVSSRPRRSKVKGRPRKPKSVDADDDA